MSNGKRSGLGMSTENSVSRNLAGAWRKRLASYKNRKPRHQVLLKSAEFVPEVRLIKPRDCNG